MRSKRNVGRSWEREDQRPAGGITSARIRADLEQRGVAPDFSKTLSERLESQVKAADDSSYEAPALWLSLEPIIPNR